MILQLVQHSCYCWYIPDCNYDTLLNNRQFRRLRQPLHRGRPRKQRTLLSLEVPCTLFLKSRDTSPCCWVEPFPSISCFHQMSLTSGGWWECGPFGCSVSKNFVSYVPRKSMAFHFNWYGLLELNNVYISVAVLNCSFFLTLQNWKWWIYCVASHWPSWDLYDIGACCLCCTAVLNEFPMHMIYLPMLLWINFNYNSY